MKKLHVAVSLLNLVLAAGRPFAHAAKMTGSDLSNMVIEGESRLRVPPQVQKLEWSPQLYRNVAELMRENGALAALEPPMMSKPLWRAPAQSRSEKTASPWLARIFEAPVLTLELKPGEDKKVRQEVSFMVKDSRGKTFFHYQKSGALPKDVVWEGFGDSGEPIHVGYDYTYTLSIQDEAGNPYRHSGKPFRLDAFRYGAYGKTVTLLAPPLLFENPAAARLSKDGIDALTEVKDFLRGRGEPKLEVSVVGDDAKFAAARGAEIRKFLAKALQWQEDKIAVSAPPLNKGGGYPHVEIIAK